MVVNQKNFFRIGFVVLLLLNFVQCEFGGKKCQDDPVIISVTDSILVPADSVFTTVYADRPVETVIVQHDTIRFDVDTLSILQDYFSKVYYSDTIRKDSDFVAIVMDTISQNRIQYRTVDFKNLRPVQIERTTVMVDPDPITQVFAGAFISGNATSLGLGPVISLKTKKDRLYNVSYDALGKTVAIGAQLSLIKL